jgi:hypothetical protein
MAPVKMLELVPQIKLKVEDVQMPEQPFAGIAAKAVEAPEQVVDDCQISMDDHPVGNVIDGGHNII